MKSVYLSILSLVFGYTLLIATFSDTSYGASIKAKEPSSPEITDAWVIPKQRRGRERRGISFPAHDSSDEYLFYNEDYDNFVSNKVRDLLVRKSDPDARNNRERHDDSKKLVPADLPIITESRRLDDNS